MSRILFIRRTLAVAALLILAGSALHPVFAGDVALPGGQPDANCPDLRLWLRADAGVRDAAGHAPADPEFSGAVSVWSDQSARHFDLAAPRQREPGYVVRQSGAGNRPTIAFGGGRMLARLKDALHDHENSTTVLVLQIERGREQGNVVFCAGNQGGKRETLSFEQKNGSDAQSCAHWLSPAHNGDISIEDALLMPADGRFGIVMIRSAGEGSCVEIQDGLGDALGANREMVVPDTNRQVRGRGAIVLPVISAASNQCGQGYCLGGQKLDQPQSGYDGQIAEVLVYNRALSSGERRALVSYLRRKYELDALDVLYPPGTMLMQAEDFDGAWQLNQDWDPLAPMCLGQRHVTSNNRGSGDGGIKRTVLIAQPGSYAVWVRAAGTVRNSGLQTSVGGKPLGVTHAVARKVFTWQLAGKVDLQPGETEIIVRGEGPGRKECDAVLISPTVTSLDGVEEICALATRLRQIPSPGRMAALLDDGRRIEGSLVSGWRRSRAGTGGESPARAGVRCLLLDNSTADAAPQYDALFEFHNGDRMRGTIRDYVAASTQAGQNSGAQLLVDPSPDFSRSMEKPIAVEIDWLRRIVFDVAGPRVLGAPPRRCPPRCLVCRDGRVIAFRAARFNTDGVSLLADQGMMRLAYRDLAEIVLQPIDPWDAYYRQLAVIDPQGDTDIVRLVTEQGLVFTASAARFSELRAQAEAAASACLVQPAWSRTPVPVAWSAVRSVWRAPATLVPLSLFAPQRVAQGGALGSSWSWQADRNVAGGELRSGGTGYFWGFGVHAPNTLAFQLPDSARAFRSNLGIDAVVGDAGCVVAKVYANEATGVPLFQSKPLSGPQNAVATGEIALAHGNSTAKQLVLVMANGRDAAAASADPLDIGDHADWLEPTLVLDPVKLRAAMNKYKPVAKQ